MLFFILIALLAMIPVGIYLYHFLKRVGIFYGISFAKKRNKVLTIIVTVIICLSCVNLFGTPALVILHILAAAVILDLIDLLIKKLYKKELSAKHWWKRLYGCGLFPFVVTACIMGYGYVNMRTVTEVDYTVNTEKNIAASGYEIALLSDIHFGTTMDAKKLATYVERVNQKNPDIVVLDGDIVDENSTKKEMQDCFATLGKLKSTYGTVYVYGNHDRAHYSATPYFTEEELESNITENGIRVLRDSIWEVDDNLVIAGREDRGYADSEERKSTKELLANVDSEKYIIMLDHQPVELANNAKAGVDLMLSGHTHGGQVWPVGLITDVLGFGELNYGEKKIDDFTAIVTSGMAGWGYPVRTGHHSEFAMVSVVKSL